MIPALRALRHRNFAMFFGGLSTSNIAMFVQLVATGWYVYRLSNSPFLLGVAGFAVLIPWLLLAPIGGLVADRVDRRKLLMTTQSLSLVQALVIAAVIFAHVDSPWMVIAINLFYGIVSALDSSTRNVFLLDLVGSREDLPNAIALQAMLVNSARFIGPALAGLLVAEFNEGWTFVIVAACYVPVLVALSRIPSSARPAHKKSGPLATELLDGFRYVFHSMPLRRVALLLGVFSFTIGPYSSIMAVFARDTFGGDARTLGLLLGASGFGALIAAVYLASRRGVPGLGRVLAVASMTTAIALALFSQTRTVWQAMFCLAVLGFGYIALVASTNTLMQSLAEDHVRGRVVGIFLMLALGLMPIGTLAMGALIEAIGERWALLVCGLAGVIASGWFIRGYPQWREAVRPLYQRAGLIGAGAGSSPKQ